MRVSKGTLILFSAAAKDPAVTSIQQTVYRMDALSPVVRSAEKRRRGEKTGACGD
jgi:polyphosphate kinase